MTPCTRCGKEVEGVHTCTPPATYAAEDLLNRLDGLERFMPSAKHDRMIRRTLGPWFNVEQVKTMIAQWVAEQKKSV